MIALPLPAATLVLMAVAPPLAEPPEERARVTSVAPPVATVRTEVRVQRMIIRVPRMSVSPASLATSRALPPIQWVERRADKCVPMTSLAAASVTRPDSVDLMLAGGKRLRAVLADNCPSLDFYSGFYLKPTGDGMVCASRDVIRSRSGGQCRIEGFRTLVPAR